MSDPRLHLEQSYRHALRVCDPGVLVASHLPQERPALILAVGKAAMSMVAAAQRAFPTVPWLATPPHSGDDRPPAVTASLVNDGLAPGSHPLPGPDSVIAAGRALGLASRLVTDDLLLVLISGGGSALWCAPWGPLSTAADGAARPSPRGVDLAVKRAVTSALQRGGADIHELNAVRRHLSRIKGGRLSEATPARVLTLALSDVPGDDLSDIASGPTVPDPSTFAEALAVIERYDIDAADVVAHLEAGSAGHLPETPKPGSAADARSSAAVIGSSGILLEAAASYWRGHGYEVVELAASLQGEAAELAASHAALVAALTGNAALLAPLLALQPDRRLATELTERLSDWRRRGASAPPLALLSGGEATVTVRGSGRGGRNLEFAGWLLAHLRELSSAAGTASDRGIWALSAGSDGVDGTSAAAGAFITPDSLARVAELAVDLEAYLEDNDSDALFSQLGDLFAPGPTGNNLNDYRAILVPAVDT